MLLVWVSAVAKLVVGAVLVCVVAGRTDYWQGWLLIGFGLLSYVAAMVALRGRWGLLRERVRPGAGVKRWDRAIVVAYVLLNYAVFAVGILDAGRYRWSPGVPWGLYLLGYAGIAAGTGIGMWAMSVNDFFSSHVRIQNDRGHRVCSTGPYRWVRHPGYSGVLLVGPLVPIVLGSLWALIPGVLSTLLIVVRTSLEDRALQRELPGYADYARAVTYRLVPRIW